MAGALHTGMPPLSSPGLHGIKSHPKRGGRLMDGTSSSSSQQFPVRSCAAGGCASMTGTGMSPPSSPGLHGIGSTLVQSCAKASASRHFTRPKRRGPLLDGITSINRNLSRLSSSRTRQQPGDRGVTVEPGILLLADACRIFPTSTSTRAKTSAKAQPNYCTLQCSRFRSRLHRGTSRHKHSASTNIKEPEGLKRVLRRRSSAVHFAKRLRMKHVNRPRKRLETSNSRIAPKRVLVLETV